MSFSKKLQYCNVLRTVISVVQLAVEEVFSVCVQRKNCLGFQEEAVYRKHWKVEL